MAQILQSLNIQKKKQLIMRLTQQFWDMIERGEIKRLKICFILRIFYYFIESIDTNYYL